MPFQRTAGPPSRFIAPACRRRAAFPDPQFWLPEIRLYGLRNRQRLLVITGRVVRLAARLGRLSQHVVYGCGVRRQRFGLPRFGKRVRRILRTEETSRFLYMSQRRRQRNFEMSVVYEHAIVDDRGRLQFLELSIRI